MGLRLLAIVALACSSVLGAEAKISGPTQARTGDLVVISAKESSGKAFKWVMPSGIQTLACSDLEFGFASGTPGVYEFMLIAADTDDEVQPIAIATHTVRVGGTITPPPVEPEEPEEPEQPTPGDFDSLRILSKESAAKLGDKATATGLASAIQVKASEIESLCERGQCPTLDAARRMMVATIENHLLSRPNSGGWGPIWRVPVNEALARENIATVSNYLAAMRAIAVGLSES